MNQSINQTVNKQGLFNQSTNQSTNFNQSINQSINQLTRFIPTSFTLSTSHLFYSYFVDFPFRLLLLFTAVKWRMQGKKKKDQQIFCFIFRPAVVLLLKLKSTKCRTWSFFFTNSRRRKGRREVVHRNISTKYSK